MEATYSRDTSNSRDNRRCDAISMRETKSGRHTSNSRDTSNQHSWDPNNQQWQGTLVTSNGRDTSNDRDTTNMHY